MDAAWLAQPWSGALLRVIADPAADLDPAVLPGPALPGWPDWAGLDDLLAVPARRGQLGRCLLDTPADAAASIAFACSEPRVRLALIPTAQAVDLMAFAAAWLDAPRLGALLRGAEVAAARAELGQAALGFATGRAKLMPRPGEALIAALPAAGPVLHRGAALFGLAAGLVPPALADRLRLRRPCDAWSVAAAHCRADPINDAAFAALRRLIREGAPAWYAWLT